MGIDQIGIDSKLASNDAARLADAIAYAAHAHNDQEDKNGEPYILHCLRVMQETRKAGGTLDQQIAAVLHDVVEDVEGITVDDIWADLDDPVGVKKLVDALTHRKDAETYRQYLERLVRTPGAALIKLQDVKDNLGRIEQLGHADERESLRKRYQAAREFLWESLITEWDYP